MQEVQGFQSTAQVEQLLLEHGERVVDRLGAEVDRVEIKIRCGRGRGGVVSHSHTYSNCAHVHRAVGMSYNMTATPGECLSLCDC